MIDTVLGWLTALVSVPRRWDGKNVSHQGTVRSAFRVVSGDQRGMTTRWATYGTTISDRQLWVGRTPVPVESVTLSARRSPSRRERWSLDADAVVVPVTTGGGAELEWGIRADSLESAVRFLGSVAVL